LFYGFTPLELLGAVGATLAVTGNQLQETTGSNNNNNAVGSGSSGLPATAPAAASINRGVGGGGGGSQVSAVAAVNFNVATSRASCVAATRQQQQ
jgi:hypothetical protein